MKNERLDEHKENIKERIMDSVIEMNRVFNEEDWGFYQNRAKIMTHLSLINAWLNDLWQWETIDNT